MRIDLKTKKPLIANRTVFGPAVFPVAVRMVWDVYEAVQLPIIGCGGVSSAEDVCEMMLAGASAVEIGAANLRDPMPARRSSKPCRACGPMYRGPDRRGARLNAVTEKFTERTV